MEIHVTEVEWMSVHSMSVADFAHASGLALAEVEELVSCGLLEIEISNGGMRALAARRIPLASRAHRVRRDFELDLRGLALAFRLLERIEQLEAELGRPAGAL